MALGEEDLRFKLTIDPDTAKMQAEIKAIGKELDAQAAKAKEAWSAVSNAGAAQLEAIRGKEKAAAGFGRLGEAGVSQLDQIQGIQAALPGSKTEQAAVSVQAVGSTAIESAIVGVGELTAVLGPLGIALGGMIAVVKLAVDGFNRMTDSIAGFVAVAAPGTFRQWQMVLEDISGVIGQTLVPVLQLLRDAFRFFGDILATLLPTARDMTESLAPLRAVFAELAETINKMLDEIGPELKFLIQWFFTTIIVGFTVLIKILNDFLSIVTTISNFIKSLLGISTGQIERRSSFGAAARPAHFTSVEEFEKGFQQAALSAASSISIPEQQLDALQNIYKVLDERLPTEHESGSFWFLNVNSSLSRIVHSAGFRAYISVGIQD